MAGKKVAEKGAREATSLGKGGVQAIKAWDASRGIRGGKRRVLKRGGETRYLGIEGIGSSVSPV